MPHKWDSHRGVARVYVVGLPINLNFGGGPDSKTWTFQAKITNSQMRLKVPSVGELTLITAK
jgi:hypothetical protein